MTCNEPTRVKGWAAAFREVPVDCFKSGGRPDADRDHTASTRLMWQLYALDVEARHRVIVVGAASGYPTALLCMRTALSRVCTVDHDHAAITSAENALTGVGFPTLLTATERPGEIPESTGTVDRILALRRVEPIPAEWINRTHAGGVIVAPLSNGVVRLQVGRGATASGRFLPDVVLPALDDGDLARPGPDPTVRAVVDAAFTARPTTATGISPFLSRTLVDPDQRDPDAWFWIGLRLPGLIHTRSRHGGDGGGPVVICHPDGSWVRITGTTAHGGGPRQLWPRIMDCYRRWCAAGRITRDHIGVSVTPAGTGIWRLRTGNDATPDAATQGAAAPGAVSDDAANAGPPARRRGHRRAVTWTTR